MRRFKVPVTTDASGNAEVFTPRLRGFLHQIHYQKGDFAAGVDFTITDEETGHSLWAQSNVDASAVVAPRLPTHSQAGAAALYASGGTGVNDRIAIAASRIKIAIAQGGNAKSGVFHFLVD